MRCGEKAGSTDLLGPHEPYAHEIPTPLVIREDVKLEYGERRLTVGWAMLSRCQERATKCRLRECNLHLRWRLNFFGVAEGASIGE
jgi:hypothetical protein